MSDMKKTGAVYEALLPPAYPVTDNNRGAYVLLTAVMMIVITGITAALKFQMTLSTFRKLRRDDIALISALVFSLAYAITICRAVEHGLGRAASELTSAQLQLLSEHYYAASILAWISMACSKCAVALLVLAIQPPRQWIVYALYTVAGVSVLWGIAASFVTAFQCGPSRYVLGPTNTDSCIDQYGAQIGIRLVDIASDVALCLLPAVMMVYVQVSVQRRLVVSSMFGMRLVTPILSAVALSQFATFYDTSTPNRPLAAVDPTIWTCVTLYASLLTATLPSIKRVLTDWAAGVANAGIMEPFELQDSKNRTRNTQLSGTPRSLAPHQDSHNVRKGSEADEGNDDAESKRRLTDGITQTVEWMVDYEDGRHKGGNRSSSATS